MHAAATRVQHVAFRSGGHVPRRSERDVFDQRRGGDERGAAQLFDVHDRHRCQRGVIRKQPRNHSHATDLHEQLSAAQVADQILIILIIIDICCHAE